MSKPELMYCPHCQRTLVTDSHDRCDACGSPGMVPTPSLKEEIVGYVRACGALCAVIGMLVYHAYSSPPGFPPFKTVGEKSGLAAIAAGIFVVVAASFTRSYLANGRSRNKG